MTPDDFPAFYQAVHDHAPFPWQARLARDVAEAGWPAVLAVPTASGKTSTLDVAVFALALQAGRPLDQRTAPLRVFLVIDRRIVVDQAAAHARKLRQALEDPKASIVAEVARRLRAFGGPGPLHVAALRGGMYRDDSWVRAPNQPTVCVSTVDQVGSRLLFRGYGLSEYRRPVHAGLAGHDALFLIDEAHLSGPFLETLAAVGRYRTLAGAPVPGPFVVVEMSATPQSSGERFALAAEDRDNEFLRARLAAPKPAALVHEPARFEAEASARARAALDREGVRVVGVVVNRVASARQVFEELRGDKGADAVLLTGRVRPWDRERLLNEFLPRVRAGRDRVPEDRPLFVVATQTVEVGADLDFDFLVTEAAPLPALRQRFGRLDRLCRFGRAAGVVVRRKAKDADPIYGDELARTWDWLRDRAGQGDDAAINFGIDALDDLLTRSPQPPPPEPRQAPVILPAHLDTWVQTCPTPAPDPDVAPFLHGADALEAADVVIVWRADLAWEEGRDRTDIEEDWVAAVAAARPVVLEGLPVPSGTARAWLAGRAGAEAADVEGRSPADGEARGGRPALRWRGPEDSTLVGPDDIRPGDTLVVPSDYGGADRFGWAPALRGPVTDVGDACFNWMADSAPDGRRSQPIRLRLHPALYRQMLAETRGDVAGEEQAELLRKFDKSLDAARRVAEGDADGPADLGALLAAYRDAVGDDRVMAGAIARFLEADNLAPVAYPGGLVVSLRVRPGFSDAPEPLPPEASDVGEPSGEDDAASLARQPVSLEDHTDGVARRVRDFATGCGLDERLTTVLERAARLHDLGKADPRFQAMLYGDEVAAAAGQLLAKSGMDREDPSAFHAAWRLSGLPRRFRHEFVSVALIRRHRNQLLRGLSADERELVEYLVGTHHGRGRAFAPVVPEERPEDVALTWEGVPLSASPDHRLWRVGSGWTDLFWRLVRRHGYWGLAYLEAVLVLADQARSRDEEEGAR
jgi:CRISPR-associated endonuclease/helicase Cas3